MEHPVHKSLIKHDLILGVKKPVLMLSIFLGLLGYISFGKFGALFVLITYVPGLILTKNDSDFLDVFLESLQTPDHFEG